MFIPIGIPPISWVVLGLITLLQPQFSVSPPPPPSHFLLMNSSKISYLRNRPSYSLLIYFLCSIFPSTSRCIFLRFVPWLPCHFPRLSPNEQTCVDNVQCSNNFLSERIGRFNSYFTLMYALFLDHLLYFI